MKAIGPPLRVSGVAGKDFSCRPLRRFAGGGKIRPLRSSDVRDSEAAAGKGGRRIDGFLSDSAKKDVDEAKETLHNLVSLLQTQRRRKKPVVEQLD